MNIELYRRLTAKINLYKAQNKLSSYDFCKKFGVDQEDFLNIQIGNYSAVSENVMNDLMEVLL